MWSDNKRYDDYMGRWSRKVARRFLPWLGAHPGARWLDVGCGTGALTSEIARFSHPSLLCGVDPSAGYLGGQSVAVLGQADARALPFATGTFDYVVSGLVLNFVPDIPRALQELRRVAREEAVVGVYVWDYAEGMELLRYFWQVAGELDSDARERDEGLRFAICRPPALRAAFEGAGLRSVTVEAIEVSAEFPSFDDYWQPFLRSQGPAFAYIETLTPSRLGRLEEALRDALPIAGDGSFALSLRAWAAKGIN